MKDFNLLEDGDEGERIVPIIAAGGPDGRMVTGRASIASSILQEHNVLGAHLNHTLAVYVNN